MNTQPESLRLADALETYGPAPWANSAHQAAAELRRLHKANQKMLAVLEELQESAGYWSEYDVPLGIVDRINEAIEAAK